LVELGFLKRYESIKKLIEFGANGYFPLFDEAIYDETCLRRKMTKSDRLKAKSLLKKISGHNNLEKQKVVFSSFNIDEKTIVAKVLLEMVEGKILDANPQIQ
jgi:hypothetical protein